MRYLILADIHANLDALTAVLDRAEKEGMDKYVILGDTVDYGAEPNETLALLRGLYPQEAVRGDHEKWFTGDLSDEWFDPEALVCSLWTRERLNEESWNYIRSLPAGPRTVDDLFQIVHGSYLGEDDYILDSEAVFTSFERLSAPIGFFGHTHVQTILSIGRDGRIDMTTFRGEENIHQLKEEMRYLVNPGSAGQPRDYDPRASFAIFDSDQMTIGMHRVPYDNAKAAKKIVDAGIPIFHARRLLVGY